MSTKLSTTLIVAQLKESVDEVRSHEAALVTARAERNELIRDALEYIPMLRLVKITGLSREQLYRIKTAAGQDED